MKIVVIFTLTYIIATNLMANNYITANEYDSLNEMSPSLQNLINDYHSTIKQKEVKFIFDFQAVSDGSEDVNGKPMEYKNYFQTRNGYIGAELQLITMKAGGKHFAVIGRQFGDDNLVIHARVHDYIFMGRFTLYEDNVDIMFGLNLHDEPKYETINNVRYFTTEGNESQRYLSNLKLYNFDLNVEFSENSKLRKTLLGYNINTQYGSIHPKIIRGNEPFEYYDAYFPYISGPLFENNGLYFNAMLKNRTVRNNIDNHQDGVVAKVINIEKHLGIFIVSFGYSETNEFTDEELKGSMFKAGIQIPREMIRNGKAKLYFGTSNNYYYDLASLRAIDQRLSTIGVSINF